MEQMSIVEAIEVINTEMTCVQRDGCERAECAKCDLVMPKEKVLAAYSVALEVMDRLLKDGDPNFPFAEQR